MSAKSDHWLAVAFRRWVMSEEGKRCTNGGDVMLTQKLWTAFRAGTRSGAASKKIQRQLKVTQAVDDRGL